MKVEERTRTDTYKEGGRRMIVANCLDCIRTYQEKTRDVHVLQILATYIFGIGVGRTVLSLEVSIV